MTIHKAKGLEFNHVFLPGLEKNPPPADEPLLLFWCERQNVYGETDLLLAPLRAHHEEKDPSYDYLNQLEQMRLAQEKRRLFYVAITRAKKSLYFTASKKKTLREGSFLSYLIHKNDFMPGIVDDEEELEASNLPSTHRLPLHVIESLTVKQSLIEGHNPAIFNWQVPDSKQFGTLFHLILFQLAKVIQEKFHAEVYHTVIQETLPTLIHEQTPHWIALLKQAYFSEDKIEPYLKKIIHGIHTLFADEKGLWILAPKNKYHNEYVLKTIINDKLQQIIIDRFFLEEDGTPWIIDYKTSEPGSTDLGVFLSHEQQAYKGQLQHYAQIIESFYSKKPRMGLYFPFIPAWIEL